MKTYEVTAHVEKEESRIVEAENPFEAEQLATSQMSEPGVLNVVVTSIEQIKEG